MIPESRPRASAYRALPDGRELVVYRMLFTWRLCLGDQEAQTYDRHWCFHTSEEAVRALEWDGNGDPPGAWIKSDRD